MNIVNTQLVVLLTALAVQQHRLKGLHQGADYFLAKPFQKEELLDRFGADHLISMLEAFPIARTVTLRANHSIVTCSM